MRNYLSRVYVLSFLEMHYIFVHFVKILDQRKNIFTHFSYVKWSCLSVRAKAKGVQELFHSRNSTDKSS